MIGFWHRFWNDYFKPIDSPPPRHDPLPDHQCEPYTPGKPIVPVPVVPVHVPPAEIAAFLAEKPARPPRKRKKPTAVPVKSGQRKPRNPAKR
jgi:hypothetical protein